MEASVVELAVSVADGSSFGENWDIFSGYFGGRGASRNQHHLVKEMICNIESTLVWRSDFGTDKED